MFYISGFYKFKKIINIKKNKKKLQNYFINNSIKGTIILSTEGINGTISGKKKKLYYFKYLSRCLKEQVDT